MALGFEENHAIYINLLQAVLQSSQCSRACLFHGDSFDCGFGGSSHLPYAHMASARTDANDQRHITELRPM